ncbi:MAG: bifunctional adenosylcobinamide kinase/adenosylcobinamide-phosphate guanylyltransferase [Gammaproteobacteria bacterium]|jgi:adenosylcobinamide kinase/adenosylcobinamide-phosphate guanylyltransferase|nr:bifunctional adenosylcobinamide kinase/adenosylcobinamide-phosphate guanylyltransferase [Gammaproteobacteria bacterium]MBT4608168.1 bifunctional adenosylcobinamide kinase/adenosylcobinamide-phosphate guanylyltransferase [Thiotrichales bacterium]MBT3471974.1 bifunctional adenosylcobinamide kinase/adenosylcobinamide-phosphate guanylyltransferase [Gammaproteobacteria bacterium]MBT3965946.1 bifunctional adenosylcobinamide kinase/adenosylcobinamide-phosphate guanylyltransferase [Gammaproteobacteri
MKELIIGGIRSGKSRYAEQVARTNQNLQGHQLCYLATATAGDAEMEARISHHQQQRGQGWLLVEEPITLALTLQREAEEGRTILVECLTLWLTNLLMAEDELQLRGEQEQLLELLPTLPGSILLVSNETGLGVVPMDPLSRRFCDEAGRLHQHLAELCERATWVVAGLPQRIKG